MSHWIDVHSDNSFTVSSDQPASPVGTVYPAEYTPVLTADDDEVCEQATSFLITDGIAYLQNSLRKKTVAEVAAEKISTLKTIRNSAESATTISDVESITWGD